MNGGREPRGAAVRAAAAALRDLRGTAAEQRRAVVESLTKLVGCDVALEYRVTRVGGTWSLADDLTLLGGPWESPRSTAGQPIDRQSWTYDPDAPRRAEVNRFIPLTKKLRDTTGYRRYYAKHDLTSQLRVLAYDGARFVGWLGLIRAADRPPFNRGDRNALNALAPATSAALATISRAEDAEVRGLPPAHLVADPLGRLIAASEHLQPWLTLDRMTAVAARVRALDAGMPVSAARIDGLALRFHRLTGERSLYLINAQASAPPVAWRTHLSPRRLEVAEFAASGATIKQIANSLGLSAHTVRQHLKHVYRQLRVASRVELARALERP